jgi:hypothetical protein
MTTMTESAQVRRINKLCAVYLHKPTNRSYYIAYSSEGFHEMHQIEASPISGQPRYINAEQLANAEIWGKV